MNEYRIVSKCGEYLCNYDEEMGNVIVWMKRFGASKITIDINNE